jgi:RNA polymerase sigma-70 factor, ECF subfamily
MSAFERLLAEARRTWPDLEVDEAAFIAHVERCAGDGAWDALRIDDLYLAFACAAGDRHALAVFEARYRPEVQRALGRVRMAGDPADVVQDLWAKLFAGPGTSKILEYRGRGDLRSWLRAAAVRAAYRASRNDYRAVAVSDTELAARVGLESDPSLAHLRATYKHELKLAFEAALASLSIRERTLLRRHHLDGLSVDDLGALYHVHRATAARWVARARDTLVETTVARLRDRLGVDTVELDSILRLVRSGLDLSLDRLLKPD